MFSPDTIVFSVVSILAFFWCAYFFGGPLVVLLAFRKPSQPGFVRLDPGTEGLPASAMHYFEPIEAQLRERGFTYQFHLRFDPFADMMDAHAVVYAHPANRDLVMALDCVAPQSLQQIEISTEFENGDEINTNNGPQLPLDSVSRPEKIIFWFPHTPEVHPLYEAHRALCDAYARAAKKPLPSAEAMVHQIRQGMRDDFEYGLHRGLFRLDPTDDTYRLTFLGAYRLSWPNMFPVNRIFRARRIAYDRSALAKAIGR